jgi:hypothetical protein
MKERFESVVFSGVRLHLGSIASNREWATGSMVFPTPLRGLCDLRAMPLFDRGWLKRDGKKRTSTIWMPPPWHWH